MQTVTWSEYPFRTHFRDIRYAEETSGVYNIESGIHVDLDSFALAFRSNLYTRDISGNL
jgi:hypothetical protein